MAIDDPFGWHTSIALSSPESVASATSSFDVPTLDVQVDASRYTKIAVIGKGGMGEVWMGWDSVIKRNVAIKVPLGTSTGDAATQLMREVLLMARLEHPGIVAVFDVYYEQETPLFVMSLIHGKPLAQQIDGAHPEDALALIRLMVRTCEAVGYAHSFGIIHRDLTPRNVIVVQDNIKVIDWGLAIDQDEPARRGVVGTPGYMSPEQARGELASSRSDVWSLGAILLKMLAVTQNTDLTLQAIAEKATSVAPEQRYPNAEALGAELQRWMDGRHVEAYDVTIWRQARRFVMYYKRLILAVALVFTVVSVTLSWGIITSNREAQRARLAERQSQHAKQDAETARDASQHALATMNRLAARRALYRGDYVEAHQQVRAALNIKPDPQTLGLWASIRRTPQATQTFEMKLSATCKGTPFLTRRDRVWGCFYGHQITVYKHNEVLWTKHLDMSIAQVRAGQHHLYLVDGPRTLKTFELMSGKRLSHDSRPGEFVMTCAAPIRLSLNKRWVYTPGSILKLDRICQNIAYTFPAEAPDEAIVVCERASVRVNLKTQHMTSIQHEAAIHLVEVDGVLWRVNAQAVLKSSDGGGVHKLNSAVRMMQRIPNSSQLLVHTQDGTTRIFDTKQRAWSMTLPAGATHVTVLANGQVAMLWSSKQVKHYKIPSATPIWRYRHDLHGFSHAAWNMNGTRLAATDGMGYVHLMDPANGVVMSPKRITNRVAKWVAVHPHTNQLFASGVGAYGVVSLTDDGHQLTLGSSVAYVYGIGGSRRFGFFENDYIGVVHDGYSTRLFRGNAQQLMPYRSIPYHDREFKDGNIGDVWDMSMDPSHRYAILTAKQGVYLWMPPGRPFRLRANRERAFSSDLNANGQSVSVSNKTLWVYDDSGAMLASWSLPSMPVDVAWRADHDHVVTGHLNGEVIVWDLKGTILLRAKPHSNRVGMIDVSRDGRYLASAGWDGYIYILDLAVLDAPWRDQ